MPVTHIVRRGDWLSRIAKKYGYRNWVVIYEAPENSEFRRKRPDPNLIYPGDKIVIPNKEPKDEKGTTGQKNKFELTKPALVWIDIESVDEFGHRVANAEL